MASWIEGVRTTAKIVTDQMVAGKTLAAIIEQGLPEQYASWGMGFINEAAYITAVYTSSANP
jgi:hypothetical protein